MAGFLDDLNVEIGSEQHAARLVNESKMQFLNAARLDPATALAPAVEARMNAYAEVNGTSVDQLDPQQRTSMHFQFMKEEQERFFGPGHTVQYLSTQFVKDKMNALYSDDVNTSHLAAAELQNLPDAALNELARKAKVPVEALRMSTSLGASALLGNAQDGKMAALINAYYKDKGAMKSNTMQLNGWTTDAEYNEGIQSQFDKLQKSSAFQALRSVMELRADGDLKVSELGNMLAHVSAIAEKNGVNADMMLRQVFGEPTIGKSYSFNGLFTWKHDTVRGFDKPGETFFSSAARELSNYETKRDLVRGSLGFTESATSLIDKAIGGDKAAADTLIKAGIMIAGTDERGNYKVRTLVGDKSLQSVVSGDYQGMFASSGEHRLDRENLVKAVERNMETQTNYYSRHSAIVQHPNRRDQVILVDTRNGSGNAVLTPSGMSKNDLLYKVTAMNRERGYTGPELDVYGGIMYDRMD